MTAIQLGGCATLQLNLVASLLVSLVEGLAGEQAVRMLGIVGRLGQTG